MFKQQLKTIEIQKQCLIHKYFYFHHRKLLHQQKHQHYVQKQSTFQRVNIERDIFSFKL